MAQPMSKLTPQQEQFCREFLVDLNGTAAYGRAYPSVKANTANANAARLLANASVQARVAELQKERASRTDVTADRVLLELARLAFFDARTMYRPDGTLKEPGEWDDATAAAVASHEVEEEITTDGEGKDAKQTRTIARTKKIKRFDKGRSLELLCRHLGMLNDKLNVTAPPGSGLDIARLPDAIKRTLLDALRAAAQ